VPQTQNPKVAPATLEWIQRAEAHERERRYDRARTAYRRAKREAPDDLSRGHAARSFALALAFWGEYRAATSELEQAVRLRPKHAASWHDLGILSFRVGKHARAEQAFRRSIALHPRDPRSRIALAAMLWKLVRAQDALIEYQALVRLDLPARVRNSVRWAICVLRWRQKRRAAGGDTAGPAAEEQARACPSPG